MELKDKLQKIFEDDYPGSDIFLKEVIQPVITDDIKMPNVEILDDTYRERAKRANITSIRYIADVIDIEADKISYFDVTLSDNASITRSRVAIQQLLRSIVESHSHLLITFHYENVVNRAWRFSYAYKENTVGDMVTAKRFTYIFGKEFRSRTAVERFDILSKSNKADADFANAFSVETLSDEFFEKYKKHYQKFCEYLLTEPAMVESFKFYDLDGTGKFIRDYVKKLFGRIVFLYFVQRKGWLNNNMNYMMDLFERTPDDIKDDYLDKVLEPLFFGVLNKKEEERKTFFAANKWDISLIIGCENIKYLNGGLFEEDDIDQAKSVFPREYFRDLFEFLNSYNFTIDENDTEDAEVGIDPEMLGRIFENLLEDNKDKGVYYTPKPIIDYMCRESIIAYLQTGRNLEDQNLIRNFVETLNPNLLTKNQNDEIQAKLKKVRICDPAIGSGAFPMGMVNILSKLYTTLRCTYGTPEERAKMKRFIIEKNIYGVDIEKGAVDIARLRFWLALAVDEPTPTPLPNLQFKIMQGNSLLECYQGIDLSKLIGNSYKECVQKTTDDLYFEMMQKDLSDTIERFYANDDHNKRTELLKHINSIVINQLIHMLPEKFLKGIGVVYETSRFFLWHTWFSNVFNEGGFDVVIGNPPYIKEYTNREAFNGFRETSPYYKGKMDLWYGFACYGIDFLKDNGIECFIAQNNWTTSDGASLLRDKIVKDASIIELVDFNDYKVFKSAGIQTMVMIFRKMLNPKASIFNYKKLLAGADKRDAIALLNNNITPFTQYDSFVFNNLLFRGKDFVFSHEDALLDKLMRHKDFLMESEVIQGIVPALDDFYILDSIEGFSSEEKQYIKPYYTGLKDRYESYQVDKYLIYLSAKNFKCTSLEHFPNIKAHFAPFERELRESKIKYKTPNKPYYFLHRERDENFFIEGNDKIAVQIRCDKPRFYFTNRAFYGSRAMFFIRSNRFSMKALTALFNSRLIEYWLESKGKKQGQLFKLDKKPLLSIPIPFNGQNKIIEKLDSLVEKIQHGRNMKISTLSFEKEVDIIIYHLFNLSFQEIIKVDPNTAIKQCEYDNYKLD